MWNGKMKAVTLSYDDGVVYDKKLVEILNYYNVKCTFNLNSGIQTYADSFNIEGHDIHRMNMAELPELYKGHEIASHTLTHHALTDMDRDTVINEVMRDKANLESLFECTVSGMAYPYGAYNDTVAKLLAECGIKYARTVWDSEAFDIGDDLLTFRPTCRHESPKLFELLDRFIHSESEKPQLFYLWGHSYEFHVHDNWDIIEKFCRIVSSDDSIFLGTNSEVFGL